MLFGERLKSLRNEKELTQADFAEYMNKSLNAYRLWENESNQPNIGDIIKMADYYQVSVDYLIGRSNDIGLRQVTETENRISSLYRGSYDELVDKINHLFIKSPKTAYEILSIAAGILTDIEDDNARDYKNLIEYYSPQRNSIEVHGNLPMKQIDSLDDKLNALCKLYRSEQRYNILNGLFASFEIEYEE